MPRGAMTRILVAIAFEGAFHPHAVDLRMLWSALAGGQGSTIWVTMLVATALPPDRALLRRRSKISSSRPVRRE